MLINTVRIKRGLASITEGFLYVVRLNIVNPLKLFIQIWFYVIETVELSFNIQC